MRDLKEQGVALVYISHKMDEIKVIADEVTIMRDGQYIGKWDVANMTKEEIIAKMVGRELSNLFPPLENVPSDEVMMKVEDFTSIHPRSFRHCSFELKKGEILGVAGLVGAQRTELMEGIFGLRAHTSGKVWIKGEEVTIKQPRDAIRKSVALLTEDRRATGILGVLSVADNISIASLDALRKGPIMLDNKKILDLVATNKEKMAIKVPSPKTQIKSLSGGNQQKVLIARWLANNPDVLILDEPTRGIDVGAKYEIYCIIADLAKQGKSIIMISSEMRTSGLLASHRAISTFCWLPPDRFLMSLFGSFGRTFSSFMYLSTISSASFFGIGLNMPLVACNAIRMFSRTVRSPIMPSSRRFSVEYAILFAMPCTDRRYWSSSFELVRTGIRLVRTVQQSAEFGSSGSQQACEADNLAWVDI